MTSLILRLLDRMNDVGAGLGLAVLIAALFAAGEPWSFKAALAVTFLQGSLILRSRSQRRATLAVSQQWRDRALKLEEQFLHAKARAEVMQDWETGLRNQRQLEAEWQRQVARFRRRGEGFSLVVLDVRNRRTPGGQFSAAAARSIADALESIARAEDSVFRLDGSRFAVLLVASRVDGATGFVRRARFALALIRDGESAGYLKASGGVAEWHSEIRSVDEMLATAEADMRGTIAAERESVHYAQAG